MRTKDRAMNAAIKRRCALYGGAGAVVTVLAYVGFVREVEAELLTLTSSAHLQLEMAARIPRVDARGNVVQARAELLAEVEGILQRMERRAPDLPALWELRAYARALEGDMAGAAKLYGRARALVPEPGEVRDTLTLNQARALAWGKQEAAALAFLQEHAGSFSALRPLADLERARLHLALDQGDAAVAAAAASLSAADAPPEVCLGAGQVLENRRQWELAEAAYARAEKRDRIAGYYVARLKLNAGEIDKALGLLERTMAGDSERTQRLIEQDAAVWRSCAGDERFRKLFTDADRFSATFSTEAQPARPGR
jgi:hypothetical protein